MPRWWAPQRSPPHRPLPTPNLTVSAQAGSGSSEKPSLGPWELKGWLRWGGEGGGGGGRRVGGCLRVLYASAL